MNMANESKEMKRMHRIHTSKTMRKHDDKMRAMRGRGKKRGRKRS